ncbi:MAG: endolytic transglycosylase MltG [Candidatus Saganbacteria bacterium]|nr:endolytic transglycosylase MltG [Candidatus Saganbacteria bacterium]
MKKKLVYTIVVIFILLALSLVSILTQTGGEGKKKTITIPKGYNAKQITEILYDSKIIKNRHFFSLSLRLLGQQDKLQAGSYLLSPKMTNISIIRKLKNGKVLPAGLIKATFPEGTSIYKMGKILEKKEYHYFDKFQKLYKTPINDKLVSEYHFLNKIKINSLEGYLFPDTYIFENRLKPEALAKIMLKRFSEVVIPYWIENATATKYNLHQILTLASIIEKEAQKAGERAIISSVYHNRLDIKMALDACPTIKYALNDPTKKVYKWQLNVKSPYNTYRNRGLPPGPICNPGMESIKAAIYPAKTNYLFFVAKKDGSHVFSKTLKEHNRARRAIPTR